MTTRKQHRLFLIVIVGLVWIAAAWLFLAGLSSQISLFKDPTELRANPSAINENIRLGGLVEAESVARETPLKIRFRVTDGNQNISVRYEGDVPDLFREGQGVIVEGHLNADGIFIAHTILAKHDENYMPKEVADSLKKRGLWQDGEQKLNDN